MTGDGPENNKQLATEKPSHSRSSCGPEDGGSVHRLSRNPAVGVFCAAADTAFRAVSARRLGEPSNCEIQLRRYNDVQGKLRG